jgi:hypothetical protein
VERQGRRPDAAANATIRSFGHQSGTQPLPSAIMDVEHINSIGSLLADLSARTEQLRGYL